MSNKDLLVLSILTFLTVVLWTFFEAYHVYNSSTIPPSLKEQIESITPTLKKDTIERIKTRYSETSLPAPIATASTLPSSPSSSSTNSASSF